MMKLSLRNSFLIFCAITAIIFISLTLPPSLGDFDIRIVIILVLLLINANYQIEIEGRSFSINYPLLFPVIAFFGPGWASLLAAIGLISVNEFESPKFVFLFNRGSLALAAGFSALCFNQLSQSRGFLLALTVSTLVYFFVNLILVIITLLFDKETRNDIPFHAFIDTFKTLLPSIAISALFYNAYRYLDVFGVVGGFLIFISLRSGALLGHLEANYRISLIKALLRAVYAKDPDLMEHLEKVAYYSKLLAKRCGYPRWKLQILDEASYFHDIGKLEIADDILKKSSSLTLTEYKEMQTHPERGLLFLKEIPLPKTHRKIVENIALYHHERYDGKGYPFGIKGDEIPLEARIVAVADTWDAMTGKRCYREAMSPDNAIAELWRVKGTQLDPDLVEAFIEAIQAEIKHSPQNVTKKLPIQKAL